MSFNYNKHKGSEGGDSFWTSYSDLFLGMSVVFLLLYVTASLRTGTNGIQQQMQNQKLTMQVQDLKNQLKMYDSVKKDYLKNEAAPEEEKLYNELMDKLSLLKEEAKNEKDKLLQASEENAKKEKALNQYQQMVRNIVNANLMSKTKIKKREEVIDEQDTEIQSQESDIANLEKDIVQKKKQIAEGERKIAETNENLKEKLSELRQAYKQKKMSEAAYERKVEAVKAENEKRLAQLKAHNNEVKQELAEANQQIKEVQGQLGKTSQELDQTKNVLQAKVGENENLKGQLSQAEQEHNKKVAEMRKGFSDQMAKDKAKFDAEMAKEKMGAAERAKRESAFKAQAAAKERELGDKISALGGQLKDTEGLLAKARAEADARKNVAKDIKEGFKKAGVEADVDEQTGEVLINFGDVYFNNDSAKLKAEMKETLKKAMPIYSKSLLGNQKVAKKISSVEIIGFASPTFKGKYVDPKGIDADARKAIDYNLDLSYNRARAIFQYIFDEGNLKFEHQKDMLPLIKVTGRSFLAEKLPNKRAPTGGKDDFCSTHDCKKAQRVIIRFSFEDKK